MSNTTRPAVLCVLALLAACKSGTTDSSSEVTSVDVTPAASSIHTGATAQLTATARDASGDPVTGQSITWQSAQPTLATVSTSGLVTGVAPGGPVTITATSDGVSGTATVTVTPPPVASATITPGAATIAAGTTDSLAVTLRDATGSILTGRSVTWTSSDATIASVSATGVVTGIAAGGPVTITATSEGVSGTASITVSPAPVAIVTLSPTPLNVVIGTTGQLTATLKDAGNNVLSGRTITWSTSNPAIATVSSTGMVTGVALGGPVTITAMSEGIAGTASVTVVPVPVATVDVSPGAPTIAVNGTVQLTATPRDAQGNTLAGRTVTWHSSSPATATVSADGLVTGVTPGGPVTITATSEGINGTATITVVAAQTIYWTMFDNSATTPQIQAAALPLTAGSALTNVPRSSTLQSTAGMAFDASGRLWVISFPPGNVAADVFVPPITPSSTPSLILTGPNADIDFLTFDHAGNLWASDYSDDAIIMFAPPFTASTQPSVMLPVPGFTHPTGVAIDAAGNVYVTNLGSTGTNSIAVFKAPVTSASVPAFYLNGLTSPGAPIIDAQGNLYASSNPGGSQASIVRYNSNHLQSGALPDIIDPTGLGTQNYEAAFTFDAAGNLYVADCGNAGTAGIRWYATGTTAFSATLAPSATYTNANITSIGCVWGIAIH